MDHFALVQNGVVVRFVKCPSGETPDEPDYTVVQIGANDPYEIGWLYDGEHFSPPPGPEPVVTFRASTKMDGGAITNPDWQTLDGVTNEPGFFGDVNYLIGQIVAGVKASGSGAQLHLLEDEVEIGLWDILDTGGAWNKVALDTEHPTEGTHTYLLEGRLNGAVSLEVRYASLVLLEVR